MRFIITLDAERPCFLQNCSQFIYLPVLFCLHGVEFGILTPQGQEFFVGAVFDDTAVVQRRWEIESRVPDT
jgi:hypothetical protein